MTQQTHPMIAKAITHIIWSIEFFASLAPRLEFMRMPQWLEMQMKAAGMRPTMATDYRRVFYDVDFVESMTLYEVAGCIIHEILHCALLHNSRRGSRDPAIWGQAADYAINLVIDKIANVSLPQGVLLDHRFEGMSAEKIYDILVKEDETNGGMHSKGGQTMEGDLLPPDSSDPSQQNIDEQEWKAAVSHAANAAKSAGTMPGGLEELFEPLLKPKLPWRQILENFLNTPLPSDRSWSRANKRYLSRRLYLPTITYSMTGDLVDSVDTSGSMDDRMVQVVLDQVAYVTSIIKPKSTTLLQHDATITDVQTFDYNDEFPSGIKIHGRGGTNFIPVFEWVEENLDEPPSALILLTDGYGPWPVDPPDYPVLWILIDSPELEKDIPYGEVALIDSSQEHLG